MLLALCVFGFLWAEILFIYLFFAAVEISMLELDTNTNISKSAVKANTPRSIIYFI